MCTFFLGEREVPNGHDLALTALSRKDEKMTKNNETKLELTISGMPEENVKLILEFDHRDELRQRYQDEWTDKRFEAMRKDYSFGHTDFKEDPYENLGGDVPTVHELAFPELKPVDPRIKELEKAMEKLTEQQRSLINDLFGACKSMEDVAKERGVTRQAIYGQKMRIIERLKKLMTE